MALAASLPPWGWWPLGPLGVAGLLRAAEGKRARVRVGLGYLAGVVHFGVALSWAAEFSVVGYLLLVLLEAGFLAAAMLGAVPGRRAWVGVPCAFLLSEAARTRWPLGGLPLGGLPLGQADSPLGAVGALAGPLGVIAVVALLGAVTARALRHDLRAASLAAAVAVAAVVAGHAPFTAAGGVVTVGVVQGGGPRGLSRSESDPTVVLDRHLAASADLPPGLDLILWPEDVVDTRGAFAGSDEAQRLAGLARERRATLVVGVVEGAGPKRFRNAAVALGPDGRLLDRYDKVHRVPFGEYVPARALFSRVADISGVPRDAIPGRGPGLLRTPAGQLGLTISFEVFFPDRARAAARAGAGLLLVPTNASSYRGQIVPAQELAAAQLRAREIGRPVLQAAPTGYSAAISHTGGVLERSGLGERTVQSRGLRARSGLTPYAQAGDLPLLILGAVGALATMARRPRRHEGAGSGRSPAHGCGRRPARAAAPA